MFDSLMYVLIVDSSTNFNTFQVMTLNSCTSFRVTTHLELSGNFKSCESTEYGTYEMSGPSKKTVPSLIDDKTEIKNNPSVEQREIVIYEVDRQPNDRTNIGNSTSSRKEPEVIRICEDKNVQLGKAEVKEIVDISSSGKHEVITICEEKTPLLNKMKKIVEPEVITIYEEENAQQDEVEEIVDTIVSNEVEIIVETISSNDEHAIPTLEEKAMQLDQKKKNVDGGVSSDAVSALETTYAECCAKIDDMKEIIVSISSNAECKSAAADEGCNSNLDEMKEINGEDDLRNDAVQNKSSTSDIAMETDEQRQLYSFKGVPFQVTGVWKEFAEQQGNYTRGCKWAPDGSCILTCSNDNNLRIFNCPPELWQSAFSWDSIKEMSSVLHASEGECIYDYCWYPLMSSYDPATCCFASASRDSHVHLWDGFTGELRCSYRSYNHLDERVTPHSLSFDVDGQKLYCGFPKVIRIFEVSRPGRNFEERRIYNKKVGQPGIVSSFAFSPWYRDLSVVGSFDKTIGIYSEPAGSLEYFLTGHQSGITQMCFSPDGTKLFSGARKDPEILCWDMRNLDSPLFAVTRVCLTNQRMYFDISKCGRYLVSGNHNGIVTVWDITSTPLHVPNCRYPILKPLVFFKAHSDCVNGISLHPTIPVLATSSGQRQFPEPVGSEDESDEFFDYDSLKEENTMRLWWVAGSSEDTMADIAE